MTRLERLRSAEEMQERLNWHRRIGFEVAMRMMEDGEMLFDEAIETLQACMQQLQEHYEAGGAV